MSYWIRGGEIQISPQFFKNKYDILYITRIYRANLKITNKKSLQENNIKEKN